ncbi:MAG: CBU_0592 family membrane protein [Solirubrobacterales bacterium]
MDQIIQILGALGILIAFISVQTGRMTASAASYLWLNVIGAGLLTVSAVIEEQWGFILLEGVWTAVALVGLVRLYGHGELTEP